MGQKTVKFSDLSGEIIPRDDEVARIVVHDHPGLTDSPVEIEALAGEASAIEQAAIGVAIVDLYFPGEDEPRRVAMDLTAFDELATDRPMAELLAGARPARRAARSGSPAPARAERANYGTLEHAGKPHRGKITDEERQLVQEHFDEINERLAAQGQRIISLSDPDHVERYGLEELAAERSAAAA